MPAYRSNLGYMNHLAQDPLLPTSMGGYKTQLLIENEIIKAGGRPRHVLCAPAINIDSNLLVRAKRKAAMMMHPREDPNTTASANRNMLTVFYNIQTAWKQVVKAELVDGQKYDYVMFLRDDAMWLDHFNFDDLVTRGGEMTDLYTLSCDARDIPMHPLELNDHGVVVSRSKANLFGDSFDLLFEDDIQKCNEQLDETREMDIESQKCRDQNGGSRDAPFSALGRRGDTAIFPKFCKSHDDPLDDFGVKKCTTLFY
jgi:hypothetical protein